MARKTKRKSLGQKQTPETSARRKVMKSLAASGVAATALPSKWTTPFVNSVVLPAHAQASPSLCGPPCGGGGSNTAGMTCNISMAMLNMGGDLLVVGDANIAGSPACRGMAVSGPAVDCAVVACGGQMLGTDSRGTAGAGCLAADTNCMVSCSVAVNAAPVVSGDCVTLTFTIGGSCTCSAVTTVA